MKTQKEMESDKLIDLIGPIGKWQAWVCFFMVLVKFPSAWYQLAVIYLAPSIKFQCIDTINETESFDSKCSANCTRYEYDKSIFENTIISEWDLVCDRAWLKNFAQTVFMFGLLTGSNAFGFVSDRYGRKRSFLIALVLMLVFGISTAYSPNYISFSIFRFFVGFASGGTMMTSFVICMELVGAKYRDVIGVLYQIPFNLGNMTLPIFAYFLRTWDAYSLAIMIPSLLFLTYFWILPESPRWLIANGKVDEATDIITKACQSNNLGTEGLREKVEQIAKELESSKDATPNANFIDLFRTRVQRTKTICSCLLFMFGGLYFFGVSQYLSETSSDIFISVGLSGAVQMPAGLFTIYFNKAFGRKKTTIISLILSGIFMLFIAFIPFQPWLRLCVALLAMSSIAITFTTIYIYSAELYPTVVRNMGMGVSSMASRVGSMVAPFVVSLSSTASWLPPTIFGLSTLTAAFVCIFLPETKGTKLPDSISNGDNK